MAMAGFRDGRTMLEPSVAPSATRSRTVDGGQLGLNLAEMTLPREADVLGANSGKLEIKGSGAATVVKLSADGKRRLSALIGGASGAESPGGVYLGLENVRGTFDAAVLNTYINLPEGERAVDHANLMAESVALYGLRKATANPASGPAMPMSKICRRSARLPSIPMTAPIVPIGLNGTGMHNGKLAGMPYFTVCRKWPISCVSKIASTAPM